MIYHVQDTLVFFLPSFLLSCVYYRFLIEPYTVLDFLATFPYYLIRYHQIEGMGALRLLRFFRLFQLLRLKKYDLYLTTMFRVLIGSFQALHIYVLTLLFLAAVFGSVIFWFEKGEWEYTTELLETPGYAFIRVGADGYTKELSPFRSIPGSSWWFFVTATTAGYGDAYPTSTCGKIVAVFALLCGVLVIAFPVSVFSELWSKELEAMGELKNLYGQNGDVDDDDVDNDDDFDDDDFDDDISYQLSVERRAPVKFVSTTSEHNYLGSESDFVVDTTTSFQSMVNESYEKNSDGSVSDSVVKTTTTKTMTEIQKKDKPQLNYGSDSESSSPTDFSAQDVADLRRYVESIEDAQQKIRKILSKIESN